MATQTAHRIWLRETSNPLMSSDYYMGLYRSYTSINNSVRSRGMCTLAKGLFSRTPRLKAASFYNSFSSRKGHPNYSKDYFVDSAYYAPEYAESSNMSFKELHVQTDVTRILKSKFGITAPTEVQQRSLPLTMKRRSCIIQSPTGTGKTLSFLIPAVQEISPGFSTLILTPTRELAQQIHYCAAILAGKKRTSKNIELLVSGYREEADLLDGEDPGEIKVPASNSPPDIVIGTPKRILEEMENGKLDLRYLRRVVMDECDKLLMSQKKLNLWKTRQTKLRHPRPGATVLFGIKEELGSRHVQLICTSATADSSVAEELRWLGWKGRLEHVQCSMSREVPSGIQHHFLPLQADSQEDVVDALAGLLRRSAERSSLLFIHRNSGIDNFVRMLRKRGLRTVALYEKTFEQKEFVDFLDMFKNGEIQVAVGTEESVRGLDFPWIRTVYLTEVPRSSEEYLHLCGRVGRMNNPGRAVVLLSNPGKDLPRLLRFYRKLGVEGSDISLHHQNTESVTNDEAHDSI